MHPQRAHFFSAASAPTPLRLDGVSFRYDSRPEQPVLTEVSLTVPPVVVVGFSNLIVAGDGLKMDSRARRGAMRST